MTQRRHGPGQLADSGQRHQPGRPHAALRPDPALQANTQQMLQRISAPVRLRATQVHAVHHQIRRRMPAERLSAPHRLTDHDQKDYAQPRLQREPRPCPVFLWFDVRAESRVARSWRAF